MPLRLGVELDLSSVLRVPVGVIGGGEVVYWGRRGGGAQIRRRPKVCLLPTPTPA